MKDVDVMYLARDVTDRIVRIVETMHCAFGMNVGAAHGFAPWSSEINALRDDIQRDIEAAIQRAIENERRVASGRTPHVF